MKGGKEFIFSFQPGPLLGKYFAGMTFCPKEVVDSLDHLMNARNVGSEILQSLIHSNKREGL